MALIMNKAFKGQGSDPRQHPRAVGHPDRGLGQAVGLDLRRQRHRQLDPRPQILWSTDGWQAKLAVIIADTWKTAPFIGLLVLAGLQVIPAEVYEAAKIDGANAWRAFWSITLPLVKPALLVAVLFRILDNLRMFDLPSVLDRRSRSRAWRRSRSSSFLENSNTRYGPAAAYAFVLFVYVVLVAYLFVKILGADVIGDARAKTPKAPRRATPRSRREGRRRREHHGRHDEVRHPGHRTDDIPVLPKPKPYGMIVRLRWHRVHHHLLPRTVLLDGRQRAAPSGRPVLDLADPVSRSRSRTSSTRSTRTTTSRVALLNSIIVASARSPC